MIIELTEEQLDQVKQELARCEKELEEIDESDGWGIVGLTQDIESLKYILHYRKTNLNLMHVSMDDCPDLEEEY